MPEASTGNTSPVLTTVTVLVFLWALVAYSIRLAVKLSKGDGWKADDCAITAAIVAALAQLVSVCYAVHRGYGSTWNTMSGGDKSAVETALYASQVSYVIAIGATRVSTGLFTANVLARTSRSIKISRSFTGLCMTWTVASMLAISLRGNLAAPWLTLNNSPAMWVRWIAVEATGFATDIAAAALVVYTLFGLQMVNAKKITVFALLNSRLILCIVIALRLYYLPRKLENQLPADIMTQVLIGATIILASVTFIKPVLRPFDPSAGGSRALRSGLFRYTTETKISQNQYYELSAARSADCSGGVRKSEVSHGAKSPRIAKQSEMDDEIPLTEVVLSTRPSAFAHVAHGQHGDGECEGNCQHIWKTQDWSVSVAETR